MKGAGGSCLHDAHVIEAHVQAALAAEGAAGRPVRSPAGLADRVRARCSAGPAERDRVDLAGWAAGRAAAVRQADEAAARERGRAEITAKAGRERQAADVIIMDLDAIGRAALVEAAAKKGASFSGWLAAASAFVNDGVIPKAAGHLSALRLAALEMAGATS